MPAYFETLSSACFRNTWVLTSAEATGSVWFSPCSLAVASAQILGSFGGGTVLLEVSNDGTNWSQLTDKNGDVVSASTAAMFDISSAAAFVRARISGGSGVSVQVALVAWSGL